MRTARWSVAPTVLVLLLSPTNTTAPPVDTTALQENFSASSVNNGVTLEMWDGYVQDPSGFGSGGSGGGGGSVSVGGGVPVCGLTGVTMRLPGGDRAEYRLCRRVEPVVSVEGVPVVVSASDVSTLLVEGSGLVRQPPGDMVIVTKDLIVYTDPSSRTLSTTVGGVPVSVVVTPVSYRWDWGDGTSTTTRSIIDRKSVV